MQKSKILFSFILLFLCSPLYAFEHPLNSVIYGATTEDDVLKTLTGQQEYKGLKIYERGSVSQRQLTREYLADKLTEFGYTPELHNYRLNGTNVFAVLPATNSSDEFLIIGAHFDSVSNEGANDNASGVAIVLAMAKELQNIAVRQKNIIFCFFDEEEKGLQGSKYFAQKLLTEKTKVHSVHTIDQMAFDGDGDFAIELEKVPNDLFKIYQDVNVSQKFLIPLHKSPVTSTDHSSFSKLGFKAMGLTEEYYNGDTTPCYHSQCDTYETVNLAYLLNTSKFWRAVITTLL